MTIRIASVILAAVAASGLMSVDAAAQPIDCTRYGRILSDLASGQSVTSEDIGWALDVERFQRCPEPHRQAASVPVPAATPVASPPAGSQPFMLREVPGPPQCPAGAPLNLTSTHACDLYAVAQAYRTGQGLPLDPEKSADFMLKAAGAGNAQAQFRVGLLHMPEDTNPPKNPAAYLRWMRLAADQGHVTAQENVAHIYYKGWGVPVNYAEAARWYTRAMEGGSVWAATSLAVQYAIGEGVPQDRARAAQFYAYAAERGEPMAQYMLGIAYGSGDGVPFDIQQARYWLQKSAAQNYDGAAEKLAEADMIFARQSARSTGRAVSRPAAPSGPSLADQAMETWKRQRKENCAAAAAGRDRVCLPD